MNKTILIFSVIFLSASFAWSQADRIKGAIIEDFGPTYQIDNPEFATHLSETFKVVFDVSKAPEDPAAVNKWIETVARYLNMHTNAGKTIETMRTVLVLHGNASYGLLKNEFYKEKFEVNNPNIPLLEALDKAGVEIILCGQTSVHRNLTKERRIPEAKISLSAMTALIQLQNKGYKLINF